MRCCGITIDAGVNTTNLFCDLMYGFFLLWSMTGVRAHRVGSTKILSDEMTEETTSSITHLTCDAEGDHNSGDARGANDE